MNKYSRREWLIAGTMAGLSACSNPFGGRNYQELDAQAAQARAQLFATQPQAAQIAQNAQAYIIFPKITKASFVLGGVLGKGAMYAQDHIINHYSLTAISYGLQAGVQQFSMGLFLMDEYSLRRFRQSLGFELGVDVEYALPVLGGLNIGTSSATYNRPIYAVIFDQRGVMAGVSLEGAKYSQY